jgi:hypothetical protein
MSWYFDGNVRERAGVKVVTYSEGNWELVV